MNAQDTQRSIEIASGVAEVIKSIRNERNYEKAAQILVEKNISISELVRRTLRLSIIDLAKLSDIVITLKK
ncbi:hypothetical protein CPG37_11925 [Malaciobacter canalis]|jgi:hypothetical protein|uniref:ANTAR domain-containing protein n=2 Tax=Malaciobacter TaxID=2321114 RepID=A0AB36ZVA0_9BACT|nr:MULTISPECIES: hypothetical protein [Malaciobacter]PHO08918.1 hypothetical protein CPG37_11925 [Malaciobacter canalis]PPK61269.1 hypothetical protein B0F89_11134 [Malaciobacter marinus]QEE32880.1 hypothetical protein ACAN_1399 [Malaciobacter canalis]SKB61016.1 hypothetical protein SAMN06295997_12334 [Malaciobacter marinus]